jgi:transposase-like protein
MDIYCTRCNSLRLIGKAGVQNYCGKCKSLKPMVKAGIGWKGKQRWECRNCHRVTLYPLHEKK